MNLKVLNGVLLSALIAGVSATANAQQERPPVHKIDLGKWAYDSNCAVCHGLTGDGKGPDTGFLTKTVPNLTTLSERNGGVFPFARVYETIDGRQVVQSHGSRDMPIWGKGLREIGGTETLYFDPEGFERATILSLTEYIYRLQAK